MATVKRRGKVTSSNKGVFVPGVGGVADEP